MDQAPCLLNMWNHHPFCISIALMKSALMEKLGLCMEPLGFARILKLFVPITRYVYHKGGDWGGDSGSIAATDILSPSQPRPIYLGPLRLASERNWSRSKWIRATEVCPGAREHIFPYPKWTSKTQDFPTGFSMHSIGMALAHKKLSRIGLPNQTANQDFPDQTLTA